MGYQYGWFVITYVRYVCTKQCGVPVWLVCDDIQMSTWVPVRLVCEIQSTYVHTCNSQVNTRYLGLECAPQAHHKWILCEGEDISLVKNLLNLFLHDHAMLAHFLHSKAFPCFLVTYQVHSPIGRGTPTSSSICVLCNIYELM